MGDIRVIVKSQARTDLDNISNALIKILAHYDLTVNMSKYTPTFDELECLCFCFFKYLTGTMITDIDKVMCFKNGTQLGTVLESAACVIWRDYYDMPEDVSEDEVLSTLRKMTMLYYCFDEEERSQGYLGYIS